MYYLDIDAVRLLQCAPILMKLCPVCQNAYPDDYRTCPRDQATLVLPMEEIVPGTILRGKYEVLGELGAGGMATVYKVRHKAFHELAAVKVVHSQFMHDPGFVKRFRNEAIVARQLKHPNAVRIDDFDYTDDGRPFIVMEYVEGHSLYDARRRDSGPWPAELCLHIVKQAASALAAAHRLGIVHRDIKPSNILLLSGDDAEGHVKILDFGIAKVAEKSFAGMTSVMTQENLVIGTPEYMSPEQAGGISVAAIDGRSDLYSLGLVFYEMLSGAHPFQADTPMGMLMQQVQRVPDPPESVEVPVSPALSALVLKSLKKNPNDRFQSADEMLLAMEDPEAWYRDREKARRIATERADAPPAGEQATAPAARLPKAPTVLAGETTPTPERVQRPPKAPTVLTRAPEIPSAAPAEADAPPASGGSRTPILIGVIVLVLALAAAAAFYFMRPAPVATVPQPAPATTPVVAAPTAPTPAPKPVIDAETKAKVAKLIAKGNHALSGGDSDIAAEFFAQALTLDPNNAEATAGLEKAHAGQHPKP